MFDIKEVGDELISVVKTYTGSQVEPVIKRLDELCEKVAALPTPENGKDADPELVKQLVKEAVAEIPVPENGKDADPELVKQLVKEAVAEIPVPENGKDADPELVKQLVKEAVAEIPVPENGKDADPELVKQLVKEAVAEIPVPENGKDADPELVKQLVKEAVAEIPVPENGKDADPELVKQLVKEAVAEIPVPENGSNGEDGRDALDLDVMQSIDEARRYRRNSYASHKGGLWKTIRTSEGMDGWECIVDGIDAVHIEMSDDRTISIKTVLSSGRVEQKAFSLPVVLDRGVYAAEKSYSQGDGVTYGGCYWIAQKDAPEGVPGASDDFRLAVKKGRDGRDLRENASKHDPSKGVRI